MAVKCVVHDSLIKVTPELTYFQVKSPIIDTAPSRIVKQTVAVHTC